MIRELSPDQICPPPVPHRSLERQVESGSMKLVDEKKALAEISTLRKHRKTVESFSSQQAAIDADKAKIDQVRKELDDPEQKAASKKFDELRKELDEVNKRMEEVSKSRDGLYDERNARELCCCARSLYTPDSYILTRSVRRSVSKQLDELWQKKKASATAFREANNAYCKRSWRAQWGEHLSAMLNSCSSPLPRRPKAQRRACQA